MNSIQEIDFDDELLTEFGNETNSEVEKSDSDDDLEFDNLVDEFATPLSDSDENKKILFSSDDEEIDNLLEDFNDEDSTESKPVQVKYEENSKPSDKIPKSSNLSTFKINECNNICSIEAISGNMCIKQEPEESNEGVYGEVSHSKSAENLIKGNHLFQNIANNNMVQYNDSCANSNQDVHLRTMPPEKENIKNLDSLVNSFIELKHEKPSPVSHTQCVTILCDENVLKSENCVSNISMSKIIEHAIDECIKNKSIASKVLSTDTMNDKKLFSVNSDINLECSESQTNASSTILPIIQNVTGSAYDIEKKHISSGDTVQQEDYKNISEDEVSEGAIRAKNCSFPVSNLSVKSEDSDNSLKYFLSNSASNIKKEDYIPSENNKYSFSKNVMTENSIYTQQSSIPKIALEIKIHISSDDNSKISSDLKESRNVTLSHSNKTENLISKTAGISINLNGLAVTTDKTERLHTNNDFHHKLTSSTVEEKLPQQKFIKRKLETSDSRIVKKKKQETLVSTAEEINSPTNDKVLTNYDKKINFSEKVLDHLSLLAMEKMVYSNFHKEYSEAEDIVKFLKEKSENLTKSIVSLNSSYKELLHAQKVGNASKKKKTRTVGINVKIIDAKDKTVVKMKKFNPKEENKNKEIVKVQEKKSSDECKITKVENKNLSVKNNMKVVELSAPASSEKNLPVKKNKEVIKLSKSSGNISPKDSKDTFVTKPKTVPTDIARPSLIKRNSRLIPYLSPTKCTSTMNNSNNDSVLRKVLNSCPQQNENIKKDTSKKEINTEKTALPHQPSENGLVPFKKFLQMLQSSKCETPKLSCSQSVTSSVTSTVTANPVTPVAGQNYSSQVKNFPFVSPYRNEMMQPPKPPPPVIRPNLPFHNMMYTKSAAGLMQNNNQNFSSLQFVQPHMQKGSMVSADFSSFPPHHPTTAAPNYMQQSNLQPLSMHHLPNSPYNPLVTMNYLSSSVGYRPPPPPPPPLSLPIPYSVASGNHTSSGMPYSAFYPRSSTSMNYSMPYPPPSYPINRLISPPHDPIQLQLMTARNGLVNVTANSPAQTSSTLTLSSKLNSTASPPITSFSKLASGTPPPITTVSKLASATPPPITTVSKLTSATPPPTTSSPKMIPAIASSQKIPPVPESLSYAEPLPKPTLNITKQGNDVMLSWNVDWKNVGSSLRSFHIYSCHVSSEIEVLPVWKKVGDISAMRLPMACRLRQFEKNNSYHFIIRAVDNFQRIGPFSNAASVSF